MTVVMCSKPAGCNQWAFIWLTAESGLLLPYTAFMSAVKPHVLWAPSQNGLFCD